MCVCVCACVCACARAHVCPLRQQLLQTAVEELPVVFVLPNSDNAWYESPGTERQRRLQKMRLRQVIPGAGVAGRTMPPSYFPGTLLSVVGSLAVLTRTLGWQGGWAARPCCEVVGMKEVPPWRGKGHFYFPVILNDDHLDQMQGEKSFVYQQGSIKCKYR